MEDGFFRSFGKHKLVMAAILAVGVALIIIGTLGKSGGETKNDDIRSSYERELEARVEALCLGVDGIDRATALVTADGSFGERAYYASANEPCVRGVALLVTNGDDPDVRRTVTELVAAALGIPTNRVSVARCK